MDNPAASERVEGLNSDGKYYTLINGVWKGPISQKHWYKLKPKREATKIRSAARAAERKRAVEERKIQKRLYRAGGSTATSSRVQLNTEAGSSSGHLDESNLDYDMNLGQGQDNEGIRTTGWSEPLGVLDESRNESSWYNADEAERSHWMDLTLQEEYPWGSDNHNNIDIAAYDMHADYGEGENQLLDDFDSNMDNFEGPPHTTPLPHVSNDTDTTIPVRNIQRHHLPKSTPFMRKDMRFSLDFHHALENATLDESELSEEDLANLRDPLSCVIPDLNENEELKVSLDLYISLCNESAGAYSRARKAFLATHKDKNILTYDEVKAQVKKLSGIFPIYSDVCKEMCCAFTGPHRDLEACPYCDTSRWKMKANNERDGPWHQMLTIPIGPTIKSLYASPESAKAMQYRKEKTQEILNQYLSTNHDGTNIDISTYDDLFCGDWYLNAVLDGSITDDDVMLMLSVDGAQLYRHKSSDCWIYIWVILELSPDRRYKKKHVIPGGIIPGKPKHMESFLFPGIHHISALENEPGNLKVYNAYDGQIESKRPLITLITADSPGMASVCGNAGHTAAIGCRRICGNKSRHCHGQPTYYPAIQLPNNFHVPGSDHPDIDLQQDPDFSQAYYDNALHQLIHARTNAQLAAIRKNSGISRPSLFSGLRTAFGVPAGFPLDGMHLLAINIPDLLTSLWRGAIPCKTGDDKGNWDWVVLTEDVWEQQGRQVEQFRKYLPCDCERPPRNPEKFINSGYKASEWLVYFYGMLPLLLHTILPLPYLTNFYKLVRAVRLCSQRSVTKADLIESHHLIIDFLEEFETLYVQRRAERMHFVRQCLHTLWHMASEISHLGPLCSYAQWTMERTIGILGSEIRLHSNPFANLNQRAIIRTSINSLLARIPTLAETVSEETPVLPQWSTSISDGFLFLHPRSSSLVGMASNEAKIFQSYFGLPEDEEFRVYLRRWSRLQLPNRKVVHSNIYDSNKKSTSSIVKIKSGNELRIAKILYYFRTTPEDSVIRSNSDDDTVFRIESTDSYALVSLFSEPDQSWLRNTHNVMCLTYHVLGETLFIYKATEITGVVTALPYPQMENWWYIVEELGMDIATWPDRDSLDIREEDNSLNMEM